MTPRTLTQTIAGPLAAQSGFAPALVAPHIPAPAPVSMPQVDRRRKRRALHWLERIGAKWEDVAVAYLRDLRARHRSWGTCDRYLEILYRFQAGCRSAPGQVTIEDCALFVAGRPDRLSNLRPFWKWAVANGIVLEDPTEGMKIEARPRVVGPMLSLAEVSLVLSGCGDDLNGRRDACLIGLLYELGPRLREILALDLDDIDARDGVITVRGSKSIHARNVTVPIRVVDDLRSYLTMRQLLACETRRLWVTKAGAALEWNGVRSMIRRRFGTGGGTTIFREGLVRRLLSADLSVLQIQEICGWRSPESVARHALP